MIPTGIIALTMSIATLAAVLLSLFKNTRCSIALLISLVGARALTAIDLPEYHGIVMLLCFFVCIWSFKRGSKYLDIDKHGVNYLVAVLYLPRTGIVLTASMGLIGETAMWLASMPFLLVQVALVIGDSIGYSQRINGAIYSCRTGFNGLRAKDGRSNQG